MFLLFLNSNTLNDISNSSVSFIFIGQEISLFYFNKQIIFHTAYVYALFTYQYFYQFLSTSQLKNHWLHFIMEVSK